MQNGLRSARIMPCLWELTAMRFSAVNFLSGKPRPQDLLHGLDFLRTQDELLPIGRYHRVQRCGVAWRQRSLPRSRR